MRWINALFLCLLISLPVLVKVSILGNYWINQQYYTKVLCVKKDVPESTCNGKCMLNMQLEKADGQQTTDAFPPNQLLQLEIPLFFSSRPALSPSRYDHILPRYAVHAEHGPNSQYRNSVFRPPALLC